MNNSVPTTKLDHPKLARQQQVAQRLPMQLFLVAILGVVLLAAPRSRIVFGAPIYFIDVMAFLLLALPLHGRLNRWAPRIPITGLVQLYLIAVLISELRGMIEYGVLFEPIYMMARFTIAISVFFTIPRLISGPEQASFVLKGLIVGTLLSATVVILYSMGPTRPIVVSALFSNSYLNPGWQNLMRVLAIYGVGETAMRGRSLVGAATMTAGFLSVAWPLAFIAYDRFKGSFIWKRVALATILATPIAILMTYGRGAWIMVGVVIILIAVFGLASGRKILLAAVVGASLTLTQVQIDENLFYFDRIKTSTQSTIDNPFTDVSTTERLYSFVEPFGHLAENPSWLIAGSGRAGARATRRGNLDEQLFDEGGLATHSSFAMAYYSFGVLGAVCQVLFVVLGFRFVLSRVRLTSKGNKEQKIVWQALLMSWCTYSLWWASGHAMVGEPRGTMLAFFLFGLLVAFEKLRILELVSGRKLPGFKRTK